MTVSVKTQKYGHWMEITKNGVRKRESEKESGGCRACVSGHYTGISAQWGLSADRGCAGAGASDPDGGCQHQQRRLGFQYGAGDAAAWRRGLSDGEDRDG